MDKKPDAQTLKLINKHLQYLRKKFKPQQILLFGSRAKNKNLKTSNINLLVISDKLEDMDFRERIISLYGNWCQKQELDIIGLTETEFENRKTELSIIGRAFKEGINLI